MSTTGADRFHRTKYSRKNLTVAANFNSGLDNVSNAGYARFFSRTNNSQKCFGDSPIAQDHFLQRLFIDLERSRAITKRSTQTDLVDGIISQLKPHRLPAHRHVRDKDRRSFDFGLERFQRGLNDLTPQTQVEILRQAGIAAGVRYADAFDDTVGAHLLGHRIHRAYQGDGKSRLLEFFAHHSAAATASPSRGDKEHALDVVLFQIGGNFLADAAHHRGRALITRNDIIGGVKFAGADHPFGF